MTIFVEMPGGLLPNERLNAARRWRDCYVDHIGANVTPNQKAWLVQLAKVRKTTIAALLREFIQDGLIKSGMPAAYRTDRRGRVKQKEACALIGDRMKVKPGI